MSQTDSSAATCRCCGATIIDARQRRKICSNTVRPLMPTLIRLLGEHYHGAKTDTEIQQLLLPRGSFETFYICRQPCLYALQRFQKLETDLKVLHGDILNRLATQYSQSAVQSAVDNITSECTSLLGKHQRADNDMVANPPTKRSSVTTQPSACRRLLYAPSLPEELAAAPKQRVSPAVTVHCFSAEHVCCAFE